MMETLHNLWSQIDWAMLGTWSLTFCLLLLGMIGTVLPFLPGPFLIFLAGALHTFLRPESGMSVTGLILLGGLLVAAYGIDIASGAAGAKWFGASKAGVTGVLIGGLVGLLLGLPGLIIGPVAGGLIGEVAFAKREWKAGLKSTWGSVLGTGVGMVARIGISLTMVATFLVDALWW